MNKLIWLIIVLAAIILILVGVLFMPAKIKSPLQNQEGLQINSPKSGEVVSSPFIIAGTVTGNGWGGFEGQVGTVILLDSKGNQIGSAILTATTDWMQPVVNFETSLNFQSAITQPGTLVFKNENPSGDPGKDKTFSMAVNINPIGETMTVKAYFSRNEVSNSDCGAVVPVDRVVSKSQAVARVALEELLRGLTASEQSAGYFTSINEGVKIQRLVILDGVAKVDFNGQLETGVGGSCKVSAIRAQITETLKQFSTIDNVIISIDGITEDILQP